MSLPRRLRLGVRGVRLRPPVGAGTPTPHPAGRPPWVTCARPPYLPPGLLESQLSRHDQMLSVHDIRLADMDLRFQVLETASSV